MRMAKTINWETNIPLVNFQSEKLRDVTKC